MLALALEVAGVVRVLLRHLQFLWCLLRSGVAWLLRSGQVSFAGADQDQVLLVTRSLLVDACLLVVVLIFGIECASAFVDLCRVKYLLLTCFCTRD